MSTESEEIRRNVRKAFTMHCIDLSKESLTYLTNYVKNLEKDARQKTIERVISLIEKEDETSGEILNLDTLKDIIKLSAETKAKAGEVFKLENVVDWKPVVYDKYSKKFSATNRVGFTKMPSFEVLRRRFEIVRSLLDNTSAFNYENSVEALISKNNVRVRVLGMLVRGPKDDLLIEDLTGSVQIDLVEEDLAAVFVSPALYFEGGIYVFEGVHVAGLLKVKSISLPPLCANLFSAEPVAGASKPIEDANDRLVFLSDVLLDNPRVMKALYQILQGFSSCPPNAFVLCGRFSQAQLAYGYTDASRVAFRHLANLLAEFSAHFTSTQFVFVPSLDDPLPVNMLPCFSLPPSITELFSAMSNVHFASNPCRIHFKGRTIVVYRDDIVEKLCRTSIHVTENTKEIPEHFGDTVWAQRHLTPLPLHLNPVLPHFDHIFALWPAPDVLVVADKFKSFVLAENARRRLTFNPGSFSLSNFEFQVFYPATNCVEASSLTVD